MKNIELLSPVGDFECLKAAVQNGADCVYFGSNDFNARYSATNFDLDDLEKAIDYAKLRNVKTNLVLNTLIKNSEFENAVNLAKTAYEYGIDAIIVQDLGLATYLINNFPNLPIHASTQMTVHNLEGVLQLEKLGFKRAVLSRELSIDEIEYICKHSNIEIEVFIHGALCISYSGQCLFSSSIGGRSGNRGKCAQACRLPYELYSEDTCIDKGYLLSPRDLCGLDYIPRLIKAGVKCLKIEGRMKSPEYVATVTKIYRKYIDLALSNNEYIIADEDKQELLQVFNRGGFSNGHLDNSYNTNLVYKEKQNHMGILLGNVKKYNANKGHIILELLSPLSIGDSIQLEKENNNYLVSELMKNNINTKTGNIGDIIEIGRMKGNINVGDKVYKTECAELNNRVKNSFSGSELKKIDICADISIIKNEPIKLRIYTDLDSTESIYDNIDFTISSIIIPIDAINQPITEERIISQISKTGNTQFKFKNINVNLDKNVYLPNISELNNLRRNAIVKLEDIAKSKYKKSIAIEPINNLSNICTNSNSNGISLLLRNLHTDFNYSAISNINRIYIPLEYFLSDKYTNNINQICLNFDTYIYMPFIIRNNYKKLIDSSLKNIIENFRIKGFIISNIGQIELLKNYSLEYIANYNLNIFNLKTCNCFNNFKAITLSPELSKFELENFNTSISTEYIVYGNLPLMNSNYCLFNHTNKCIHNCKQTCKEHNYYLKDRLGFLFKIYCDNIDTLTTIYNSKTTSISPKEVNSDFYRIDILDETIDEINSIIDTVKSGNRLEGNQYTNGNFYREV